MTLKNNFKYEYDIVIDPGHGGIDPGGVNGSDKESNHTLSISKTGAEEGRS